MDEDFKRIMIDEAGIDNQQSQDANDKAETRHTNDINGRLEKNWKINDHDNGKNVRKWEKRK